jgi:hypothetical protein
MPLLVRIDELLVRNDDYRIRFTGSTNGEPCCIAFGGLW